MIPEDDYNSICDEIASLVRVKCSPGDAKGRVALRHGVSLKTIDRIWSKRDQYPAVQVTSDQAREMLEEVLRQAFSPAGWKESREAIILASESAKIDERN